MQESVQEFQSWNGPCSILNWPKKKFVNPQSANKSKELKPNHTTSKAAPLTYICTYAPIAAYTLSCNDLCFSILTYLSQNASKIIQNQYIILNQLITSKSSSTTRLPRLRETHAYSPHKLHMPSRNDWYFNLYPFIPRRILWKLSATFKFRVARNYLHCLLFGMISTSFRPEIPR